MEQFLLKNIKLMNYLQIKIKLNNIFKMKQNRLGNHIQLNILQYLWRNLLIQ